MRYRKLDSNGDAVFGGDQSAFYVNVPAAVAQAASTRLGLQLGEFFLDVTDGTNWRTGVLGKYTQATRDDTIRTRILGTQGAISLESYSSVYDSASRTWTVNATLNTMYGAAKIVESQ